MPQIIYSMPHNLPSSRIDVSVTKMSFSDRIPEILLCDEG